MSTHRELSHLTQMDYEHLILLTCIVPTGPYHPYFCFLVLIKLLIVNLIPIFKKRCPCPKNLTIPVQDKRQQMDADRWGSTRKLLTFLQAAINGYHILIIMMMMMICCQKNVSFCSHAECGISLKLHLFKVKNKLYSQRSTERSFIS